MRLQLFTRLEANCLPRRDRGLLARARVAAYSTLPGLDYEDAEAAQLDSLTSRQRPLHGIKDGAKDLLGFSLGNARAIYQPVHDVLFDHGVGFLL
jgi:hypothetical protein